jgi:hypothetical protein
MLYRNLVLVPTIGDDLVAGLALDMATQAVSLPVPARIVRRIAHAAKPTPQASFSSSGS